MQHKSSAVQCSTVQCSAVQCSSAQCSAVQYSTVQCSAMQFSTAQFSAAQCSAVLCSAVQCNAVQCSSAQFSAVQCSAVQHSAMQFSTAQFSAVLCSAVQCSAMQWSAAQFSAVQFSAVQCSAVQHSSVQCSSAQFSSAQCSAAQYSAVQCSAAQFSAVQHSSVQHSAVTPLAVSSTLHSLCIAQWLLSTLRPNNRLQELYSRLNVEMFAQFLDDVLRASMMKMQRRERRSTLQYKDQIRPTKRRPRPTKCLQIFYVKIYDILSSLWRRGATSLTGCDICTSDIHRISPSVLPAVQSQLEVLVVATLSTTINAESCLAVVCSLPHVARLYQTGCNMCGARWQFPGGDWLHIKSLLVLHS